jgi:hypothetical protein
LASRQFVDGRRQEGDVASELIRGITGKSPDDVRLVEHADTRPVPSPEIELEAQFLAARDSKDFGAATQVRYKQARLLLEMGRSDEAAALLLEALKIADEPSLNGTKFRDSLIALLQINTGELENWINSAVHRTAALGELREVPDECQSAAIRVLRMAGIAEWENWFQAPIVDTQALLSLPRAGNGWPAARLLRLRLHNIKSFPTLMLDFREALGAPRLCSAFVGDNGTGKSTLLQTIAVACLGAKAASKIPGLAMRLIRQGASSCEIEAEFELRLDVIAPEQERKLDAEMREAETLTVSVGVEISPIDEDFRLLSQPRMQFGDTNRAAHWEAMRSHTGFHWGLCCAYGAFRNLRERMGSSASPSAYASPEIDRVLSLFQPHSALIEPTFLEKLLQDGDVSAFAPNMPRIPLIERDRLLSMFQQMIPGLTVEQDADGTRRLVEERGGIRVRAFASLSDGCNSMLGLLGHLCRHCLEVTGWTANPLTLGGIVLIDEIDLHLHPSWQRRCLPQLQSAFPNIQFIVTTHSPLILGGVPDGRVTVLRRDPITGIVISDSDTPSVKGWRVDQLLTGLHFETFSYDLDTERITMQYAQIVNNPNASADEIAAAETALKNQKSSVRQELPPDLEAIRLVRQDTDQRLANMDMEQRKRVLAELLGSLPGGA